MTTTPTSDAADLPEARLFTKKPVTIEAIQWTGKNLREVIAFTDGPPDTRTTHAGMAWEAYTDLVARDGLKIYTLEGKMLASPGDWIIRGVKGEMYPCKDDIFEATYSPAALAAGQATAAPAQPVAQQGVAYAALPAHSHAGRVYEEGFLIGTCPLYAADQMRSFADATHALRASNGQAPADAKALAEADRRAGEAERLLATCKEAVMRFEQVRSRMKYQWGAEQRVSFDEVWDEALALKKAAHAAPQPPTAQADSAPAVDRDRIREIFMAHGFTIKEGQTDLKQCVYDAAEALLRAARVPADSVQEDAALWHWLAEYLVGTRTDLDDEIVASETVNDLRKLVKAAIKQGEKQ